MFSKEFEQRLNELILTMPEKTALIFRLSKIDEMPVKKIAAQLDLSEKAVEYHVTKSLKFLRENFKDFYSANSSHFFSNYAYLFNDFPLLSLASFNKK